MYSKADNLHIQLSSRLGNGRYNLTHYMNVINQDYLGSNDNMLPPSRPSVNPI